MDEGVPGARITHGFCPPCELSQWEETGLPQSLWPQRVIEFARKKDARRNPQDRLRELSCPDENHLSHGFYMVSEKTAQELASSSRSRVSPREKLKHLRGPRDGMLPSAGFELLVEHGGEFYWLAQTPHQRRMVWSIRKANRD